MTEDIGSTLVWKPFHFFQVEAHVYVQIYTCITSVTSVPFTDPFYNNVRNVKNVYIVFYVFIQK